MSIQEEYISYTNISHFIPTLKWQNEYTVQSTQKEVLYRVIEDETTNLLYLNDPKNLIRFKCFLLATIGVPVIHVILCALQTAVNVLNIFLDILKIILNGRENLSENLGNLTLNLFKLILAPLLVIALEITAVLGLLFPLNARKIYSSIERAMTNDLFEVHTYFNKKTHKNVHGNKSVAAPCFQSKCFNHQ